jgi:hypothetical protein
MQRQTKITLSEIALMIVITAEVVIFIGYTKPGHLILDSLGLMVQIVLLRSLTPSRSGFPEPKTSGINGACAPLFRT